MSTLLAVRHGQASFLADDYDQLSALGEDQSRRLGEFWVSAGIRPDRVFHGSLKRHRQTCAAVSEAFFAAGIDWPEPVVIPGINEFEGGDVMKHIFPELVKRDPSLKSLETDFAAAESPDERNRTFQRMFVLGCRAWIQGEILSEGVESWVDFKTRVKAGVSKVRAALGKGEVGAMFSSGGPLGVMMQFAIGINDTEALEMGFQMRNAAYCEYIVTPKRFNLSVFNTHPHLANQELITYR